MGTWLQLDRRSPLALHDDGSGAKVFYVVGGESTSKAVAKDYLKDFRKKVRGAYIKIVFVPENE